MNNKTKKREMQLFLGGYKYFVQNMNKKTGPPARYRTGDPEILKTRTACHFTHNSSRLLLTPQPIRQLPKRRCDAPGDGV